MTTATASRAITRVHGWTTLNELGCPCGRHNIRQDSVVLEHGGIRCKHREPAVGGKGYGPECGQWVYVLGSIGWSVTEKDGVETIALGNDIYVVEVTWPELKHIRETRLSAPKVLEYLGIPRMTARARPAIDVRV
jgi:hypothetical protein